MRFEAVYIGDVLANLSGGLRRKTEYLDNVDLTFTFEPEELLGWKGATFFLYGLGNREGDPSADNIGDIQTVTNIEAYNTWKFLEAWFQQDLLLGQLSLLLGLYDLNSEFDAMETAGFFSEQFSWDWT